MSDFEAFSEIQAALLEIPSVFERLIHIVSLANSETAGAAVRPVLAMLHSKVFAEWLRLSLEEKLGDLKTCARRQRREPHELVLRWLRPRQYETLIPAGALAPERELFRVDLETLLPILVRG